MKIDYPNFNYLVIKELDNELSAEEALELENYVRKNEDLAKRRDQMRRILDTPEARRAVEEFGRKVSAKDIIEQIIKDRRAARKRKMVTRALATCLCIAIAVSFLWPTLPSAEDEMVVTPTLVFTLSNGITIRVEGNKTVLNRHAFNLSDTCIQFFNNEKSDQMVTLTTPPGVTFKCKLPDGSDIELNAATSLSFLLNFNNEVREIAIVGEAFIEAAQDASSPLYVSTPDVKIQVLGTSFNVNTYHPHFVKIGLVTGTVKVSAIDNIHSGKLLRPNEEALFIKGKGSFVIQPFDKENALSWRQGLYYYHDMPLYNLCIILSRIYAINFVLDDPDLRNLKVSGMIDRKIDILKYLKRLDYSANLHHRLEENIIHISK